MIEPCNYKCYLCGSSRSMFFVVSESLQDVLYRIYRCQSCDLIQTVDRHAPISPTYIDLESTDMDEDRLWVQANHKAPAFTQWFELVEKSLFNGARLLDIGCGTGGFLHFVKDRGMQLYGFDASKAQAEYAAVKFDRVRCASSVSEYCQMLGDSSLKFDFITMWDVLEHIREPVAFLREIGDRLSDQGVLFVSIPNGGALRWKLPLRRALGKEPDLIPWEHVFFFSRQSLAETFTKAGLHLESSGAVKCYPRAPSIFEMFRRIGFFILTLVPSYSPQLYGLGRRRS